MFLKASIREKSSQGASEFSEVQTFYCVSDSDWFRIMILVSVSDIKNLHKEVQAVRTNLCRL